MKTRLVITLFVIYFSIINKTFSQFAFQGARTNITGFTNAEQQTLVGLMHQYIDAQVITDHCDMRAITGGDIHSDFDFLPFHRAYLQGMEDFLVEQGYPQFVPLPYWDPAIPAPLPFRTKDSDCSQANCLQASSCNNSPITSWSPNVVRPPHLIVNNNPGQYNDLCDFNMNPTSPSSQNCCPWGLSNAIEGDIRGPNQNGLGYHNFVHDQVGGYFELMISPASPAFWLWHAYVDQIWFEWEKNCTQSTTPNIDLYMKDHPYSVMSERDMGEEPNIYNYAQYLSYEIWCRNQPDGLTNQTHQNPISDGVNQTHVYVRVRNRGKFQNTGNEQLKLYWAKAATNLSWPNHWDGSLIRQGEVMGDQIGTVTIPAITPQDQEILHFTWMAPDPSNYSFNQEPFHFCLLARIVATNDPMYNERTTGVYNLAPNVKDNNNIVWKNLSIIDMNPMVNNPNGGVSEAVTSANVFVGNDGNVPATFDFVLEEIIPKSGNTILEDADINLILEEVLWDLWEEANFNGENVDIIDVENHEIRITADNAKLLGLTFEAGEVYQLTIDVSLLTDAYPYEQEYDFKLEQRVSLDGTVVGGEGYKVYPTTRTGVFADAGLDRDINSGDSTELKATDVGEPAKYIWFDQNGELVKKGKNVFVSPIEDAEYVLEVTLVDAGIKDVDKVNVNILESRIVNLSPNPAEDNITIDYQLNNVTQAHIIVLLPYGGSYHYPLDVYHNQIQIDISAYQTGIYAVSLICDGQNVDYTNFIKN